MPTYKIKIDLEEIVKADSEDEVLANFENSLTNESMYDYAWNEAEITEVCPECEEDLQTKMIDLDGTNVEERKVCEKCGYGYPVKQ